MKTITVYTITYEYTYTSLDLARISMLTATDKLPEAMEYCAGLVKPAITNPDPEALAVLRYNVAQAIMSEISQAISGAKNSPAPSTAGKP